MKLITENLETSSIIIEAKENSTKNYYIEGIFLQGNITNGNGRRYPTEVLDLAVSKYRPLIEANRALGELNHPPSPKINYERAAIKTISLIKEGNNYIGKAKLLSTPLGTLCKGLVDDGVQLAVSSRGLGSMVESNGINVVQNDYEISAAADIVSDPSAPDAFVRGIVEGVEWVYAEGGMLIEQRLESIKKLADTNNKKLQEQKYEIYKNFLNLLCYGPNNITEQIKDNFVVDGDTLISKISKISSAAEAIKIVTFLGNSGKDVQWGFLLKILVELGWAKNKILKLLKLLR